MAETQDPERGGILGLFGWLIGGGCLLVALVSVFNTAFDLGLDLAVSGTSTPLPNNWDEVIGLAAVGALIVGLTAFGGFMRRQFAAAKGRPWVRLALVGMALALLGAVARLLFVLAIKGTYGSMLAYYACDGDLEDVKAELARGPDRAALDEAVGRAAQYDNEAALALLLAAGADMRESTSAPERQRCALLGRSLAFVKVAIDHGVRADACPKGEAAIWDAVRFGKDDAETAATVTLLLGAGWSATAVPDYDKTTAAEHARQKGWPQTQAALAGAR